MKRNRLNRPRLVRPADAFILAAFGAATLVGRGADAGALLLVVCLVRGCALCTADALRAAFAIQPDMRRVQGSAALALVAQCAGAGIAYGLTCVPAVSAALTWLAGEWGSGLLPLNPVTLAFGLLVNIEHVFYEFLCATGDGNSALLSRGLSGLLTLTGILLAAPLAQTPTRMDALRLLLPPALAALTSLAVGLSDGGRLRPRLNGEIFRRAPISLLQTLICPAAILALFHFLKWLPATPLPLTAGLILYTLCRTPFRRSHLEARPLNRALIITIIVCAALAAPFLAGWKPELGVEALQKWLNELPHTCAALATAALCAAAMFSRVGKGREG